MNNGGLRNVNRPKTESALAGGIYFLLHLSAIYVLANFAVVWLAAEVHNVILPLVGKPSAESRLAFAFDHLPLFSILCGAVAGFIAATYRHRAAWFVWIVPTAVLAYKFVTFPSSIFQNGYALAFHHYIAGGFLIPEFHSLREMLQNLSSDDIRGADQVRFSVPVYVGAAYSCAAWIGGLLGIRLPLLGAPPPSKTDPPVEVR
jgi:hypothetical protein